MNSCAASGFRAGAESRTTRGRGVNSGAQDVSARSLGAHHIAVVDVETTGLSPWRHDRIIEIGVVLSSPDGEIEDEHESLVTLSRPWIVTKRYKRQPDGTRAYD